MECWKCWCCSSSSGFVALLNSLKNWLILVVRPLLMSVSFVVFVFHACLSCCCVVEFVLMCCVCCCCCSVKEGCRRIFPFSSFIGGCFHVVILFWIHLCFHVESCVNFSGGVFPLLVLFHLALVDPLFLVEKLWAFAFGSSILNKIKTALSQKWFT